MSLGHNNTSVTSGLVFAVDRSSLRSYYGQPTTNQFATPAPNINGDTTFAVQGTGTFQRIYSGSYGDYTIQPTDVVYQYVLGAAPTGCHYHGNSAAIGAGQFVNFSFDYYVSPNVTSYVNNQLANLENYGGGALSGGLSDSTPSVFGQWKTVNQTFGPTSASGTQAMFLYPGGCGSQLATTGFILYKNPQVTFTNAKLQWAGWQGTRSVTNSLVDLTGTTTVDLTNTSFDASGNYTFNGTSSYFNIANNAALRPTQEMTIEMVVKATATTATWKGLYGVNPYGNTGPLIFLESDGLLIRALHYVGATEYRCNTNVQISTSVYKHVVFTFKTGTNTINDAIRSYFNGVADVSVSMASAGSLTYGSTASPISVGLNASGTYFNGDMPLLRVYNRALTASEVQQNFASCAGRFGL